jgi:hypothetical protein
MWLTAKKLDAWEMVVINTEKPPINPETLAQIGKCSFVKDLTVCVKCGVGYYIASDLFDFIDQFKNAPHSMEGSFFKQLLSRIKSHAAQHYQQDSEVIIAWGVELQTMLRSTLPVENRPTSLQEPEILNRIGILVADWVVELEYRLERRAYYWDKSDYPKIQDWMKKFPGPPLATSGFPTPLEPRNRAPPQKMTFPHCKP